MDHISNDTIVLPFLIISAYMFFSPWVESERSFKIFLMSLYPEGQQGMPIAQWNSKHVNLEAKALSLPCICCVFRNRVGPQVGACITG